MLYADSVKPRSYAQSCMLLWLANSEMTAALTSLAFVPPKVSGPVAGTIPPAKLEGLQRLVCQAFVNGAK